MVALSPISPSSTSPLSQILHYHPTDRHPHPHPDLLPLSKEQASQGLQPNTT